jgi:hypothetical protein
MGHEIRALLRVSTFYASAAISGAFSSLLAFALAKMDGIAGGAGWRWIFIIEGIATVAVGIAVPFIRIETPERPVKWLNEEEQRYLEIRIADQDGGVKIHAEGRRFSWRLFWSVVTDWQIYIMAFAFLVQLGARLWSQIRHAPDHQKHGLQIQRRSAPVSSLPPQPPLTTHPNHQLPELSPPTSAAPSPPTASADKFKRRSYFLVIPQTCLIISFSILAALSPKLKTSSSSIAPCYFAAVFACIGNYPISPGCNAWISNKISGPAKRTVGLAFISPSTTAALWIEVSFTKTLKRRATRRASDARWRLPRQRLWRLACWIWCI